MHTMAPNLPTPKIMPTVSPNLTVTEGGLSPELLAESGVNGLVIDPEANTEAVCVTKQTRKQISFVNKCIQAKRSLFMLSPEDPNHDISSDIFFNGKIILGSLQGRARVQALVGYIHPSTGCR